MVESPFSSYLAKNPGKIPIFRTFKGKFSMFAYISLKIGYFELGEDYDITVKSFLSFFSFLCVCMERGDPSYTMISI